jgi:hypothetical protein
MAVNSGVNIFLIIIFSEVGRVLERIIIFGKIIRIATFAILEKVESNPICSRI